MGAGIDEIRQLLDETSEIYYRREARKNDPVEIVWEYTEKDRECVALLTASMAYGRVDILKKAVRLALQPLGQYPKQYLLNRDFDELKDYFHTFRYRMTGGDDLLDLLYALRQIYNEYESLEDAYLDTEGDHIQKFGTLIRMLRHRRLRTELTRGFKYLLTDPSEGSTAKRMHLFARWMVRGPDEIDIGLWHSVKPSVLVMPLDTHTSRICRYLGMTTRRSNDLKAAVEITQYLKRLDPKDPLRYDFPICHLGISGDCIHTYSETHCARCPLQRGCTIANAG